MATKKLRRIQEAILELVGSGGDSSELAEEFRGRLGELGPSDRLVLYSWMSAELEIAPEALDGPLAGVAAAGADPVERSRALNALRDAVASPRRVLLEGLGHLPGGVKTVLELRAELLEAQRAGAEGLEPLEEDVAELLTAWFRHGFLRLDEIDRRSPFEQIRFLKERELVHPMVGLEEMGRRLGRDRRCFALFHCLMPDEPVVFIEVALTRGLVKSIHEIIDEAPGGREREGEPDTAIFYSINNTQIGLAGLGLGKVLVFRVTEALRASRPGIRRFATLSPIPGFWRRYLKPILEGSETFAVTREDVEEDFSAGSRRALLERWTAQGGAPGDGVAEVMLGVLERPDWISDPVYPKVLAKPLEEIAFRYLGEETDARGKPLNPVAGFHLGNGATVSRRHVHFGANRSPRGLAESCSLMVSYMYSATWLQQIGRTVQSLLPFGR